MCFAFSFDTIQASFEKIHCFLLIYTFMGRCLAGFYRTTCVLFFLFASATSSIYAICIVNVAHLNGVIVLSSDIAFDFFRVLSFSVP